jgi:hypothetical protein
MENFDSETLESNLNLEESKNQTSENRTKKGFTCMSIGALVLLGGCISNLIMPSMNDSYNMVLYGITSIGATVVFYGLYCVME